MGPANRNSQRPSACNHYYPHLQASKQSLIKPFAKGRSHQTGGTGVSIGHAGERAFEWAVTEGGAGGVAGAVLGAILGWPESHLALSAQGQLSTTHYSNAFTSG